jgi:nickel-dependent lactate racemase
VKISLPYGGSNVRVQVPDENVLAVIEPREVQIGESSARVRDALQKPVPGISLEALLRSHPGTLFIVNDVERATPTAAVLDDLERLNLLPDSAEFIVATGTHAWPGPAGLETVFRRRLPEVASRVHVHDGRDEKSHVRVGRTSRGTDVLLDRRVVEAEALVVIGSVEPHYFAGFTGGRKGLFPGIAAYPSIEKNHRLAMGSGSQVMRLQGNPVHEDMAEAAGLLGDKPVFSIQVVLDGGNRVCGAFAGGLSDSLHQAAQLAEKIYGVPVAEPADIVVAVVDPPLDRSLYQAHKAIENTRSAVKPGGILILAAACSEGIGDDSFVRLLSASRDPEDVLLRADRDYRLGFHKAARIADLARRISLLAVTRLEPDVLKSVFMHPFDDLQSALDASLGEKPEAKILFVLSAGLLVPLISGTR